MQNKIIDLVMYASYKAQRDNWFNPEACTEEMLQAIEHIYPDWETYELKIERERFQPEESEDLGIGSYEEYLDDLHQSRRNINDEE